MFTAALTIMGAMELFDEAIAFVQPREIPGRAIGGGRGRRLTDERRSARIALGAPGT